MNIFNLKRYYFFILVAILSNPLSSAFAQGPAIHWDKSFGGSDDDFFSSIKATADGGYIMSGTSYSGISSNKSQPTFGLSDYWIVKLDRSGNKQWDKVYGGSSGESIITTLPKRNGGYMAFGVSNSGVSGNKTAINHGSGSIINSDIWIISIDNNGNKRWEKTIGTNDSDGIWAVQPTNDGGYILLAENQSAIPSGDKSEPGRGDVDYWVVKIDSLGNVQWDRTLGGNGPDRPRCIIQTADGGFLVGGTSASGISGDRTDGNRGAHDYWAVKLDASGTKQWDHAYGGTSSDLLLTLHQTIDGGYLMGGEGSSGGDMTSPSYGYFCWWVIKTNANGVKLYDKTYGGTEANSLCSITSTTDGGFLLGGSSSGPVGGTKTVAGFGGWDYWLIKTDANLIEQWQTSFGGPQTDYFRALAVQADGTCVIGGYSASNIGGSKTQAGLGANDYWLIKLSSVVTTSKSSTISQPLTIYPNPASQHVMIHVMNNAPHNSLQMTLFDVNGKAVQHQALSFFAGDDIRVNLEKHPAGLYLLLLVGPQGYLATQKIRIE